MLRTIAVAIVMALLPATLSAAPPATAPTTAPAVHAANQPAAATAPMVKSPEAARARYESLVRKAQAEYLTDLKTLQQQATKAGNAKQAKAIDEMTTAVQAADFGLPAPVDFHPTKLAVAANADWQSVGPVRKGEVIEVRAAGTWCVNVNTREEATCDAAGMQVDGTPVNTQQFAILMARIGNRFYAVDTGTRIVADEDAPLEFRSNDWNTGDNDGAVMVTLSRHHP